MIFIILYSSQNSLYLNHKHLENYDVPNFEKLNRSQGTPLNLLNIVYKRPTDTNPLLFSSQTFLEYIDVYSNHLQTGLLLVVDLSLFFILGCLQDFKVFKETLRVDQ